MSSLIVEKYYFRCKALCNEDYKQITRVFTLALPKQSPFACLRFDLAVKIMQYLTTTVCGQFDVYGQIQ
jgi:hypothetical protein